MVVTCSLCEVTLCTDALMCMFAVGFKKIVWYGVCARMRSKYCACASCKLRTERDQLLILKVPSAHAPFTAIADSYLEFELFLASTLFCGFGQKSPKILVKLARKLVNIGLTCLSVTRKHIEF